MISILIVVLTVLLALHFYGAAFASWQLSKSEYFDPSQKYAQYLIIWLIPVFGTALVLHILGEEVAQRRPDWVPWFDAMLVAAFESSAGDAIDTSGGHIHSTMTDSSDSGGNHD